MAAENQLKVRVEDISVESRERLRQESGRRVNSKGGDEGEGTDSSG